MHVDVQAELEATLAAKKKLDYELQDSMGKAEFLRCRVENLNSDLSKRIAKVINNFSVFQEITELASLLLKPSVWQLEMSLFIEFSF